MTQVIKAFTRIFFQAFLLPINQISIRLLTSAKKLHSYNNTYKTVCLTLS